MYLLYFFASHCLVLLILLHAIRQICVLVYLLLSLFIRQSILVRDFTVCMFFVLQCLFLNCRTFGLALLGDMIAQHLSGIVYCRSLYSGTEPLGLALSLILAHK